MHLPQSSMCISFNSVCPKEGLPFTAFSHQILVYLEHNIRLYVTLIFKPNSKHICFKTFTLNWWDATIKWSARAILTVSAVLIHLSQQLTHHCIQYLPGNIGGRFPPKPIPYIPWFGIPIIPEIKNERSFMACQHRHFEYTMQKCAKKIMIQIKLKAT